MLGIYRGLDYATTLDISRKTSSDARKPTLDVSRETPSMEAWRAMLIRKSPHPITIKEIASLLNMSHSTVSRALNDRSNISETTKTRVRKAADELGYVANLSARMIRGDAAPVIGLIIPDVRNDFYSNISKELSDRCRGAGVRMLLAITEDDPEIEKSEIRALLEARVSGIAITMTSKPQAASLALLEEVPFVQLVRRAPKLHRPAICMEDELGCRAATEHLLDLGHRRIAYVGTSKTISAGRDRVKGFLRAHEARGVEPVSEAIELVPPRQAHGFDGVSRALTHRPTALVIGSSELTIGGLRAIRAAGLEVPRDISIVGYGDPVWFELLSPALTAMSLPVAAMADAVADQLSAQIEDRKSGRETKPEVTRIMPALVVRGSTRRHENE